VTSGRILLSNGCYTPPVGTFSPINQVSGAASFRDRPRCLLLPPRGERLRERSRTARPPAVLVRLRHVVRIFFSQIANKPHAKVANAPAQSHDQAETFASNEKRLKTTRDQRGRPSQQQRKQVKDPSDDDCFWAFNQYVTHDDYYTNNGQHGSWKTAWARLCYPPKPKTTTKNAKDGSRSKRESGSSSRKDSRSTKGFMKDSRSQSVTASRSMKGTRSKKGSWRG
jgi:hypothetical protein